jgi:hypothetical protein
MDHAGSLPVIGHFAGFNRPGQASQEPIRPDQTRADQTRPDQTRPDQARPDQTRPDQTRPDQTRPDHYYKSSGGTATFGARSGLIGHSCSV